MLIIKHKHRKKGSSKLPVLWGDAVVPPFDRIKSNTDIPDIYDVGSWLDACCSVVSTG